MRNLLKTIAGLALAMSVINCSGGGGSSDDGSTAAPLVISGKLGTSASLMSVGENTSMAVTLTDLEIYAVAFTTPPAIAQANVNADGSFSVNLPGAKGASVTAIFRDKTSKGEVGTVVFKDNSKKDLSGNAKESSSIVLADNVSLGDINLGSDGKVTVDVATVAASNPTAIPAAPASSSLFDMSGVWTASAFSPLPTDYITTCPAGTPNNQCEGLPDGAQIAMIRFAGKDFTPTSGHCNPTANPVVCTTSDGTVGTGDRYALAVWEAPGLASCGYKTGFTADEARANGLIDITSLPVVGQQISYGAMTNYNPYFWLKQAATSGSWPIMNCQGISVNVGSNPVNGYACYSHKYLNSNNSDTTQYGWQVSLGNGGCFDTTTQKPVMVTNWANLTPVNNTCQNSTTGLPAGFTKSTCTYTGDPDGSGPQASTTFQCTWTGGQFAGTSTTPDLSTSIDTSTYHLGAAAELIAANTTCGIAGDGNPSGLTLAKAQCAANYYFQNQSSPTCGPEPRFNWSATTLADFYHVDYRQKPKSQFLLDILSYDSTGTIGTLDTEERESFTIPSGSNSSVTCEMARKIVFNAKKTGANTAVVEVRFSGRMASTAAACVGVAKQALDNIAYNKTVPNNQKRRAVDNADLEYMLQPQSMIFNMTKQ